MSDGWTLLSEDECLHLAGNPGVVADPRDRTASINAAVLLADRAEATAVHLRSKSVSDGLTDDWVRHMFAFGWMLYEVSFPFAGLHGAQEDTEEARKIRSILKRFAECAESIEHKQYAVRAAGALRAYALALSKVDRPDGYLFANEQHEAGDRWMDQVLQHLGNPTLRHRTSSSGAPEVTGVTPVGQDPALYRDAWAVHVQLETAKAGTACRRIETYLCDPDRLESSDDVPQRMREIARTARAGVLAGLRSIEEFAKVRGDVDPDRRVSLAQRIWERQAANMTARAQLLLAPALAYLHDAGMPYHQTANAQVWSLSNVVTGSAEPQPSDCWAEIEFIRHQVRVLIERAEAATVEGKPGRLTEGDVAETARVRLHYLQQFPGDDLPAPDERVPYGSAGDGCGVEQLSAWLVNAGHDANVIGTATFVPWVEGLVSIRRRQGDPDPVGRYVAWREAYPRLDRFLKHLDPGGEPDEEVQRHLARRAALFASLRRAPGSSPA